MHDSTSAAPAGAAAAHVGARRSLLVPLAFAAFVAGVLALGVVLHLQARQTDREAATEALAATARLSAFALNTWLTERQADAEAIGTSQLLARSIARWRQGGPQQTEEGTLIQEHLDSLRRQYAYGAVVLVDTDAREVRFASGRQLDREQVLAISRADAYRKAAWIELPVADVSDLRTGIVRGVVSPGRVIPWTLYLELRPQWLVDTLHQAQPTNWAGETLLLHRGHRGIRFLSSSTGARLTPLEPIHTARGHEPAPVVEGLLAGAPSSLLTGPNRHGERVLAKSEPVQLPGWKLASQLTEQDVYAGLHARTRLQVFVLGALLVLGSVAFMAWRRAERHKASARELGLRSHYEAIMRQSADIFVLTDEDARILDASESALAAYGYTRTQLIGLSAHALRLPGAREAGEGLVRDMRLGDSYPFQEERIRADGSKFLLEGTVSKMEAGGRYFCVSMGRDVTSKRAKESQVRVAASFFERSAAGIIISDADKRIIRVNAAVTQITGYTAEELIGQRTAILNAGLEPELMARARECILREDHWEGELRGRRKDGSVFPSRLLISAYRGTDGKVEEIVDIFTDLTRLKRAERQAEYLAQHDPLTDLPNRAMLERELPVMLAELDGQAGKFPTSLTVALINLDRFKSINESFGHAHGDALLLEVAKRLRSISPQARTLYRYGGDEFVLVMTGNPVTHALLVSEVRALLAPAVPLGDHPVSPTASIGIASYPDHARQADDLMRNVESAMRIAKAHGRNTWRVYEPEMNATAFDDMLLAVDLRRAIDAGDLQLHLQAQYTMAEGALVGVEALLRWHHPTRGAVPPGRFIPIAESSGMISEISHWVLREAARIWSGWRAQGLVPLPIAVNLSAVQFQEPGFVEEVGRVLEEFDLPPGALEMELTESIIMADTDAAIERMFKLADMGVQLAIDDFGTGYSSLSYLRRFPVKKLKIDRSFVLELGRSGNKEGEAIATAVIAMAKSLKLKVIAEGVETEEQRDFLRAHGCDEVQGYLYGKPIPVAAVTPMLPRLQYGARAVKAVKIAPAGKPQ